MDGRRRSIREERYISFEIYYRNYGCIDYCKIRKKKIPPPTRFPGKALHRLTSSPFGLQTTGLKPFGLEPLIVGAYAADHYLVLLDRDLY